MRRRELLAALAAQPLVVPRLNGLAAVAASSPRRGSSRVRPGGPDWPSRAECDGAATTRRSADRSAFATPAMPGRPDWRGLPYPVPRAEESLLHRRRGRVD